MAGVLWRVVPKGLFDFSGLSVAAPSVAQIVAAQNIDISRFREVTMIARLHATTGPTTLGTNLYVSARVEAPTDEDSKDFISPSDLQVIAFFAGTDSPPVVRTAALPRNIGGTIRIYMQATTSEQSPGPTFTVSVDLSCKE